MRINEDLRGQWGKWESVEGMKGHGVGPTGAGEGDDRESDPVNPYQPSRGSWGTLGKERIVVNRSPAAPRYGSGLPQAQLCSQIPCTPVPNPRRRVRPAGGHQGSRP